MKKSLVLLAILLGSLSWISWNKNSYTGNNRTKEEVISCYNMEIINAYQKEASSVPFALLHQNARKIENYQELGKMINFQTEDGKEGSAYFIAAKKKTNNWLIVIQEWWGLNDNIKKEA
ncbi:MAG: hypothetical protein RL316_1185, partial [Bacteroidota bacterium]